MVSDYHGLAGKGFSEHCCQPVPACCVQLDSILGREEPAMVLDDGKIRHPLPRLPHGEELVCLAEQGEVRPQDAAQKLNAADFHLIVVEDVDVVRSQCLQLIDQGTAERTGDSVHS